MDLSVIQDAELRQIARNVVARCMVDRVFFFEDVMKVALDPWQKEVCEAMDAGETKVSIRSAVGVGKTMLVSILAIHFGLFRDDVKVIITSPSFNQLNDGIIPEVKKWIGKLPDWLKEQCKMTSERITFAPDYENNFISFRTARKETPEALQGIHATHVLLLVDEASAVSEAVFDAGSGTMSTAGSITVMISNTTRVTGLFYKSHRKLKHLWKTWKITSDMSSRVDPLFPIHMRDTYGIDSQQYKIRVMAEFPEGNADSVIPRSWVEEAVGREIDFPVHGEKYWGVDPGRGGDPSGFCEVVGRHISELEELNYSNLMQLVGYVKKKWDELDDERRPENIFVDVIGMGSGVHDRLLELGLPVVGVNVAEAAAVSTRFVRLRAELWHNGRLFFERKDCVISTAIPDAIREKFIEELAETAFREHSTGKMDVESKRELKARGLASPNLADAFLLTQSVEGAVTNGLKSDKSWGKPLNYHVAGMI